MCSLVVGPPAPNASVARRRAHADAERVDARDDVAVRRDDAPAHRVAAARQPRDGRVDRPLVGARARLAARGAARSRRNADRVRQRVDALVEVQPHELRRALDPRPVRGLGLRQRRVRRGRPPAARARRARRRAASSPVRLPGERREVAEHRRDVAVGVEEHGDDDQRQRQSRSPDARPRPEDARAAGTARRSAPSSRARGAGTPPARSTSRSARGRAAPRRRRPGQAERRGARRGGAASRAAGRARRPRRASSSGPTRRGRPCGSSSW